MTRKSLAAIAGRGLCLVWLAWLPAALGQTLPGPMAGGVVIAEVGEGSALDAAGLSRGDRIVSWQRPVRESSDVSTAGGEIRSVFDWQWVKIEQAPRGRIELQGWRGPQPMVFSVSPGSWHGEVLPSQSRENAQGPSCWSSFQEGDTLAAAGQLQEALSAYDAALNKAADAVAQGVIWDSIGAVRQRLGASAGAREAYRTALEIRRLEWNEESLGVAKSRSDLGNLAWNGGDLELAAEHHGRALEIRQALAPGSLVVADSLKALGVVVGLSGDLPSSADYVSRALHIQEELAPGGLAVAESLNHLAILSARRGKRELAEETFHRSLAIRQALDPGSLGEAATLINLGRVAWKRGDLDGAQHRYEAALAIQEKLAPGSGNLAILLSNLGLLALDRGHLEAAEAYCHRALAIRTKLGANSLFVADSLSHLAKIAVEHGRLATADHMLRRALVIQEQASPDSLFQSDTLFDLGEVAAQRRRRSAAEGYHRRALTIRQAFAPGSAEEAESLHALGRLVQKTDTEQAAKLFRQAIDRLEAQIGTLGGSEGTKSKFRARHRPLYQDLIDLLLDLGREEEAFHILERSRARSFLAMLAERELLFSIDLPVELETARRTLAVRYDRALAQLFRLSPQDGARFDALSSLLVALRRERDHLVAEIRRTSGRFGELQYPQPLTLADTRQALDAGTLMLSYSVGPRSTHIFAVTRDRFDVVQVDLEESDLRRQIRLFRQLIQATGSVTEIQAIRHSQLISAGRALYESLVRPFAGWIARSERVLVVPDGPLHVLPFRALVPVPSEGAWDQPPELRYLIEWKPLHTALSATVYHELRKARRSSEADPPGARAPVLLTAFGDPHSAQALNDFSPLPHARQEVERISALYPPSSVQTYLGKEATEERAKSVGRETRILHFATHATLDDRFPLHAALALSTPPQQIPGRENGLLQTFEVFESLRLDADLVVLSGCETGLGQELGGEGLIGLTRAFQYAGAQTVAASLWSVQDEATAELMVGFHRNLRRGLSKAEALRAVQMEFIRRGAASANGPGDPKTAEASSPFVWAAFELYGDWR